MNKADVYQVVTDRILETMKQGIIPWQKPWHGGLKGAISHISGKPYSLINQILLGREGEYASFEQIKKEGGKVKKGAKSNLVVFFKMFKTEVEVKNDEGEIEKKIVTRPILRYYYVFHIDDCEGISPKFGEELKAQEPIKEAETIISEYYSREEVTFNPKLSDRAYYSPTNDEVIVPSIEQYQIVEEYYSTAFHETVHSTGHPKRLNRELSGFFGTEKYSKEELIAEIGSAFLCDLCGLDNEKAFKNSVGYIQGWMKEIADDRRLIVSAATRAEKAVKYILTGERPAFL